MRKELVATAAAVLAASAVCAWELRQEAPAPMVTYVAEVQPGDTVWDLAEELARPESARSSCAIWRRERSRSTESPSWSRKTLKR